MLLKIRHALLEVTSAPTTKQSAIIINNEVIISSACILQPYVRPLEPIDKSIKVDVGNASAEIIRKLQQCQLVNAQANHGVAGVEENAVQKLLNSLSFQVTFDQRKLPQSARRNNSTSPKTNSRQPHILTRYRAQILYIFSAAEVSRNLHKVLFAADNANDTHNMVLRSSFVVLSMRPNSERERFDRFLEHIGHYLRYLQPIHTLDDVLVMCTPFGLDNFYKTISIGKVSNVMGRGGCLFSLSNALPLGCEGAAVFNNKLRLIGIVVCTSFYRHQENVNLTLAANFAYLLRDFMRQLGITITSLVLPKIPSSFAWERTLVVIESAGRQGTGTFIRVRNKNFILTCAHVVGQLKAHVICRGVDGEFQSNVLWCNPEHNRPYDIALLTAPDNLPERYCVRLSNQRAILGQTVFNAGFPYFVNFNLKYDFNPSIFQGRIIKCDQGSIMSDGSVQAGQSGGPMFDQNGFILGVCVSNLKIDNVIYPNINTAVPIYDIRATLLDYVKSDDPGVLNNLVANQDVQGVWALNAPQILSKL